MRSRTRVDQGIWFLGYRGSGVAWAGGSGGAGWDEKASSLHREVETRPVSMCVTEAGRCNAPGKVGAGGRRG